MALIDFDKFLASFITEIKKNHMVITYNIPSCIKKALEDQGLGYKNGEIVKVQRRVSAEAKENGYSESEDEKIRKEFCKDIWTFIPNEKAHKYIAWLEKQVTSYTKRDVDDAYVEGMAFAKDELEKQKPAWSEEDEKMLRGVTTICDLWSTKTSCYPRENDDIEKLKNWLKSLKQRIGG